MKIERLEAKLKSTTFGKLKLGDRFKNEVGTELRVVGNCNKNEYSALNEAEYTIWEYQDDRTVYPLDQPKPFSPVQITLKTVKEVNEFLDCWIVDGPEERMPDPAWCEDLAKQLGAIVNDNT
jgi:hypothetical protein